MSNSKLGYIYLPWYTHYNIWVTVIRGLLTDSEIWGGRSKFASKYRGFEPRICNGGYVTIVDSECSRTFNSGVNFCRKELYQDHAEVCAACMLAGRLGISFEAEEETDMVDRNYWFDYYTFVAALEVVMGHGNYEDGLLKVTKENRSKFDSWIKECQRWYDSLKEQYRPKHLSDLLKISYLSQTKIKRELREISEVTRNRRYIG